MAITNKATGAIGWQEVDVTTDNCNRPATTAAGLAGLEPVMGTDKSVTAGNASQLADGAAACVLMESRAAERANIEPLGAFRGIAVAGCAPDEMGIGPVYAIPRLLERHGLKVQDIDLWELNEAFASQALYCQRQLAIPMERLNVNGGLSRLVTPSGSPVQDWWGTSCLKGNGAKPNLLSSACALAAEWGLLAFSKYSDCPKLSRQTAAGYGAKACEPVATFSRYASIGGDTRSRPLAQISL